ncbi:50S ribosomal protein L21e [Sulfolobales archaeon HS-7]|nr:50S ribosomal protein L21e [Sulfolobales archaeon HS-7]
MVKASKGNRQKSRNVFKKSVREKGGVPSLSRLMYEYKEGERVAIDINSAIHKGMPHRRFQGRTGEIVGRRGRCYIIRVSDGNSFRTLFTRPEHLKPLRGQTYGN